MIAFQRTQTLYAIHDYFVRAVAVLQDFCVSKCCLRSLELFGDGLRVRHTTVLQQALDAHHELNAFSGLVGRRSFYLSGAANSGGLLRKQVEEFGRGGTQSSILPS